MTSSASFLQPTKAAVAAVRYLKTRAASTGKVGAAGFCFCGGGVINLMAINSPDLYIAVDVAADAVQVAPRIRLDERAAGAVGTMRRLITDSEICVHRVNFLRRIYLLTIA